MLSIKTPQCPGVRSDSLIATVGVLCIILGLAAHSSELSAQDFYSPPVGQAYPDKVYWGDTHVHTSYSSHDANIAGKNRASPEIAYRFARGEVVNANNGMPVRLQRPLDFLVVADHAEGMGVAYALETGDPDYPDSEIAKKIRAAYTTFVKSSESKETTGALRSLLWDAQIDAPYRQTLWQRAVARAEKYNEPGRFTAFAGFEWSAAGLVNLHRVVIFKDGPDKTAKIVPFSQSDSNKPEDLWAFLDNYEASYAGNVIAIPHNSNVSSGEMFAVHKYGGDPITKEWAKTRSRFEPLMEVTQFKGDSEAHPALSPTDEFADFETWNSWSGPTEPENLRLPPEEYFARKRGEYARAALKTGLDIQATVGVNPFKYGLIGSTDTHTSLSTADSDNFWGKFSGDFPKPRWYYSAAGYAAVWATENTRESLFAAMQRRETYATTGPRIRVRFFGGWAFEADDALRPDLPRVGYSGGVPMGGDLTRAPVDTAPKFLIHAVRDPNGANLDRVQVVKGWRSADGQLHEKVYDVALSDDRKPDSTGKVPLVGSTVSVADAFYTNSIGDPELSVVWTDPTFDPGEFAFYYLRVLEIPTPRWTAYNAKFLGMRDEPDKVPMVTQQRGYTSPIWYTP
jgi:hypothetical protein